MKRQNLHILYMITVGMIFQVSPEPSKYAHINHNLPSFWQTYPPHNLHPGNQWGHLSVEPEYQNDYLKTKTKRSSKGWILGKDGQHALLCYNYLCMKMPIRTKQGQKHPKEKRGTKLHTLDGRIRML